MNMNISGEDRLHTWDRATDGVTATLTMTCKPACEAQHTRILVVTAPDKLVREYMEMK